MSVTFGVELVEWDAFRELWRRNGNADFFREAEEYGAEWVVESSHLPSWNSSWNAATDFSNQFRRMAKFLPGKQRKKFERFLYRFCLENEDQGWVPLMDLGKEVDEYFFSTISPESAAYYLDLWEKLDMEELRDAFDKCPINNPNSTHMSTFEYFRSYPKMWGDLLREAVSKSAGIVLTAD